MHCPQCGQQQVSDAARYCKNCGFSLVGVRRLLDADSVEPTLEKEVQRPLKSQRRKGVRQGVILLFVCMVLMPLTTLSKQLEFLPMLFMMAGLMRILYAVIFQEGAPKKIKQNGARPHVGPSTPEQLGAARRGSALSPAPGMPVAVGSTRRADTAEMVTPPSVTEHTTRLLNETQDSE